MDWIYQPDHVRLILYGFKFYLPLELVLCGFRALYHHKGVHPPLYFTSSDVGIQFFPEKQRSHIYGHSFLLLRYCKYNAVRILYRDRDVLWVITCAAHVTCD